MDVPNVTLDDADVFLRARFGTDAANVELLAQGAWSRAFGFTRAGRELVIRFGTDAEVFRKDRLAAAFGSPVLPVPEVLEIGDAFDAHYAISARARGEYLEDLDEAQWRELLPAFLAALDALRAVDIGHTDGYGGWDARGGWQPSWRRAMFRLSDDAPPDLPEEFERGRAALGELVREPPARHVVHGDLLHRNVLVADGKLSAVFDWQCSLYGDFLWDYAWIDYFASWHPGVAGVVPDVLAHVADEPDRDERIRACCIAIGLDHIAYCARTARWDDMRVTAARTADYL